VYHHWYSTRTRLILIVSLSIAVRVMMDLFLFYFHVYYAFFLLLIMLCIISFSFYSRRRMGSTVEASEREASVPFEGNTIISYRDCSLKPCRFLFAF
jgi:uncharacterized membrane protein